MVENLLQYLKVEEVLKKEEKEATSESEGDSLLEQIRGITVKLDEKDREIKRLQSLLRTEEFKFQKVISVLAKMNENGKMMKKEYQGYASKTGLGLGISLIKKIVNGINGKIIKLGFLFCRFL